MKRPKQQLIVTGTDTGVGKTMVAGHLLRIALRQGIDACYQKWVSTGDADGCADLHTCLAVSGYSMPRRERRLSAPYSFSRAASPHFAAEQEKKTVDPARILEAFHLLSEAHDLVIAEGAGGLMVPLARDLLLIDLVARANVPVLMVARSGLGTLNHTLLSLEALKQRHMPVLGVVFVDSGFAEDDILVRDNMRTVGEMAGVSVFGRIPRLDDPHDTNKWQMCEPALAAVLSALTVL